MMEHRRDQAPLSNAARRTAWLVVGLLFAAGFVSYLNRSTLSIANHDIAAGIHLAHGQMDPLSRQAIGTMPDRYASAA